MTSVARHYADHLAPIYVWMAGGLDHAIALGAIDVAEFLGATRYAVDLGAGFGMHAIPLARAGAQVLAIDSSAQLLSTLESQSTGLAIRVVQAELSEFPSYVSTRPDLILCMGDTLTHLVNPDAVEELIDSVAATLQPGGMFLASFRDYRQLPSGDNRFIAVRSDQSRIHTCFLEGFAEHVLVHDLIHERLDVQWKLRTSSYQKLRLNPDQVRRWVAAAGLRCEITPGPRGMLSLRARA